MLFQTCNFSLSSYYGGSDEILFDFKSVKGGSNPVFEGSNLDYSASLIVDGCSEKANRKIGGKNFSECQFRVVLQRQVWKYVMEKIAPSTLIVIVSWVILNTDCISKVFELF